MTQKETPKEWAEGLFEIWLSFTRGEKLDKLSRLYDNIANTNFDEVQLAARAELVDMMEDHLYPLRRNQNDRAAR